MFKTLRLVSLLSFLLSFALQSNAQLPYKESFTRSTAQGMVFGGRDDPGNHDAFLTANPDSAGVNGNPNDADGAGYLRLTKTLNRLGQPLNNQAGYVRNTTTFPSGDGLSITFEYYTHGAGADYGYNQHGDGISIFLFDASAASTFQFGGFGGSLGYAQRTGGLPGVSKGFIGIGIDEFGNFATTEGGKSGGNNENTGGSSDSWAGYNESSVTLRGDGDGSSTALTNYEWLRTVKTYANYADFFATGTLLPDAFLIRGNVDGRTKIGPSRTAGGLRETEDGYRKVKVDLEPDLDGIRFKVNVWITEGKSGVAVPHHVISDYMYTPTSGIPANLSYGFGASTGSAINIHEIRALDIVVPASVTKVPVAEPDVAVTLKNTPKTFDITGNDHDPNGNFQLDLNTVDLDPATPLRQTTVTVAGQGTYTYAVVGDVGEVTFTPVATFDGVATPISYTISDNGKNLEGAVVTGTSQSLSATITVSVLGSITGTVAVCQGATTTLGNSATGGTWSSGTPGVATINASTGLVTGIAPGTTTITYTLGSQSVTQAVTVSAPVSTAAVTGGTPICIGSTVQLASATPGGVWTSLTPATATVDANGLVTGVATGTVTITYTVTNGACSDMKSASITVNALPTITLTNANPEICFGTASANIPYSGVANGANQYSIDWNAAANTAGIADVSNAALVASNITISSLAAVAAGTYTGTLTVRNSVTGCVSSITAVTVKINALPTITLTNANPEICVGTASANIPYSATTNGANQYSIDWDAAANTANIADVTNASLVVSNITIPSLAAVASGTYTGTLTVRNSTTGCVSSTTAVTVKINALPVVTPVSGAASTTVGSTTAFTSTPAGGVWSSDNTAMATVNTSGVVTGVSAGTAVITYTVTNAAGCVASVSKTITITTPAATNAPPVVQNITKSGAKDQIITFTAANFSDADHYSDPEGVALTKVKVVSLPSSGTLKLDGANIVAGQEIAAADLAKITFVPPSGFTGNVTFDWNGSDGVNYAVTQKAVSITLLANNTLPVIADIPKTGSKDTPVPFTPADFTSKFSDTDPLAKIRVVSLPGSGVLKFDGVNVVAGQEIPATDLIKITFVPATGFTGGPVSFLWNGSDGTDYAATPKNVNITITTVNNPPVAVADAYTTVRGGTLTVAAPGVLSNDTNPNGNPVTAVKVSNPLSGTVILETNGSFVYTHNGSASTSDSFTYKVNDGSVDGNTVTVSITVNAVNQPPVVSDISKIGTGFTPIIFSLEDFTTKFSDPDGSPLGRVRITRLPLTGTLKLNGSVVVVNQEITATDLNMLTFEPPVNWNGNVTFGWNGYDGLLWAVNNASVNLSVLLAGDPTAKIGLAKSLVSVKPALNGTYDIKFLFTAVNYGAHGLERISVRDNLAQAFGGATITVKSLTAIGSLSVNPSFNGTSDTELLNPASKLIAGEEATIELMINIRLLQTGGMFQNSATAEAYSVLNGFKVSDISTNGLKPDPQVGSDVSSSEATPILLEAQPLYSPQGFSPNGDGTNDKFVIQNTNGKQVSLEVYNRWGNRVYKADDYQNDWGGEVTEGFFVGRDIPDGTYYYIIVIDKKDKYSGFITINR